MNYQGVSHQYDSRGIEIGTGIGGQHGYQQDNRSLGIGTGHSGQQQGYQQDNRSLGRGTGSGGQYGYQQDNRGMRVDNRPHNNYPSDNRGGGVGSGSDGQNRFIGNGNRLGRAESGVKRDRESPETIRRQNLEYRRRKEQERINLEGRGTQPGILGPYRDNRDPNGGGQPILNQSTTGVGNMTNHTPRTSADQQGTPRTPQSTPKGDGHQPNQGTMDSKYSHIYDNKENQDGSDLDDIDLDDTQLVWDKVYDRGLVIPEVINLEKYDVSLVEEKKKAKLESATTAKDSKLYKSNPESNHTNMPLHILGTETTCAAAGMEATSTISILQKVTLPTSTVTISAQPTNVNGASATPTVSNTINNNPIVVTNPITQPATPVVIETSIQEGEKHALGCKTCSYDPCPGFICGVCNGPSAPREEKMKYVANAKAIVYVEALRVARPIPSQDIMNRFAKIYSKEIVRELALNPSADFEIPEDLFKFLVNNHIASHSDASDKPVHIKNELKQETMSQVKYKHDDIDNNDIHSRSAMQQQRRVTHAGGSGHPFIKQSSEQDHQNYPPLGQLIGPHRRPHERESRMEKDYKHDKDHRYERENYNQQGHRGFGQGFKGRGPPPPGDSDGENDGDDYDEYRDRNVRRERDRGHKNQRGYDKGNGKDYNTKGRDQPPSPPPGDSDGEGDTNSSGSDNGSRSSKDSENSRNRGSWRHKKDTKKKNSKETKKSKEEDDNTTSDQPLLSTPVTLLSRLTNSTKTSKEEEDMDPLQLITSGTAAEIVSKRQRQLDRLAKPYNPVTDSKQMIKKDRISTTIIDNIGDAPQQMINHKKVNELQGVTAWCYWNTVSNGEHLAKPEDFKPPLQFDPRARLRTFIEASNEIEADMEIEDDKESIERQITLIMQLTLKTLTVPMDSVSARNNIHDIVCTSPHTVIHMLTDMMNNLKFIDETAKEKESLLVKEARRAITEYDDRLQKQGKHSNLWDKIVTLTKEIAAKCKEDGMKYSSRELLLRAGQQLEMVHTTREHILGRGKGNGSKSQEVESKVVELEKEIERKQPASMSKANSTQWKSLSTFNPKSRSFKDKLRRQRENNENMGLLGNSTQLFQDNDLLSAMDELNNTTIMEDFTKNYYSNRDSNDQDIDEDFIYAFAEYVLEGGPLAATTETLQTDYNRARVVATLVQKSWQVRDDLQKAEKEKEDAIKKKESEDKASREQFKAKVLSGAIREAQAVANKVAREVIANNAPQEWAYEREEYSDREQEQVYNNSGPLQISYPMATDEVYVNQGSYKDNKYREMTSGNQQYNQQYSQQRPQNNPRPTYQNQMARPYNNNQTVNGVQTMSKGNTPQDHCSTCGLHLSECENITAATKDAEGNRQCSLRDNLKCQFGISIVALNKTKLLLLSKQQFEKVLSAATRFGCLQGSTREEIQEMKDQLYRDKEKIIVQAQLQDQHEQHRSLNNENTV